MINERLKQLRTARGLSQNEMADILEVSLSSYQKYEREKNSVTPSLDVLMRIADYYKVSVDYLLGRSTDTPPLSQLASQFNMSALEREIVDTYLTLPEIVRDSLMDFLEKAVAKAQTESKAEAEKALTTPVEQSEPEVAEVAVAARSFGENEKPPEKLKLKKRPGAGSILDASDYKAD